MMSLICVFLRRSAAILLVLFPFSLPSQQSRAAAQPDLVESEKFAAEVTSFLGKELAAHVADIHSLDPPQEKVEGALTIGEFSWGTFLRALASYSELSGERALGGRDLPQMIGKSALIESRHGGKAFAQMYAAMALRSFGPDLNANPIWKSL